MGLPERVVLARLVVVGDPEMGATIAVEEQVDMIPVPFHGPDMERLRPCLATQFGEGLLGGEPLLLALEPVADIGEHGAGVIFHDVDLAALGPANPPDAECPERRPAPEPGVDAGAHLELPIGELMLVPCDEARGRHLDLRAVAPT